MTYKRKWLPGEVIHTMNELISQGTGSNDIVFLREKPYSMGWILSMQAHTIITYLERGDFRRAVPADGNKGANLMYSTQNKQTKIINLPRGAGKTTRMLYASEFNNVPILCGSLLAKQYLIDTARRAKIQIPTPITVNDFIKSRNRPQDVLVDDALYVLQRFMDGTKIMGLTLSAEAESKQVYCWSGNGVEIKRISDLS